jgi:2-hydroxychromene-2-carboxylate isomerase
MDIENDLLCFFNFRSPYAYIGIKKAIDLGLKPVFLPFCYVPKEILEAVTLNNPYKRDYLMEDCKRLFDEEKINLVDEIPADCNWPKVHAVWHIINEDSLDLGLDFMLKAFECRFQKGLNIGSEEIIIKICNDIGFDSEIAINAMEDEEIDNYLKSLTKIMRELKVFGVPTLVYKRERFWGQDRLPYIKSII